MSAKKPVAFYAPLKSPNHPLPSGDRTMARLLMRALDAAGFAPELASELRTLDRTGDRQAQENLKQQSLAEVSRLIVHYKSLPEELRPRLWFTYHVYYKAPDWIGPLVSEALNIPYVIAEGSRAAKRAQGPWALAHEGAEEALDHANVIFVMTAKDRVALEQAHPAHQILIDLPPFLDASEWPPPSSPRSASAPRLLTVAMMREGDKLASYRILASALEKVTHLSWSLDIVGDGEARAGIEPLFAPFLGRVRFHGQIESRSDLAALYEAANLFVWPAVNEAYGMVLLEAQLFGCAVIAGNFGGVSSVVEHGRTGLLTLPGDATAFADATRGLLEHPERLRHLGDEARRFVTMERTLDGTATRLREALSPLTSTRGARACAS
ncbi:glycosyl transferase family 1 [Microvirga vignae]|uniref:Glycosyl transferase family 1 n=1 Tax=Microvirga vignae TaxID=1225564 RepID=A0A0H1R4Q1_9HYPH|nr:glycosyltransferase family 4 protein [Microvirga vignae]KLK90034.1 glycosyl transferase family 1 [Microvirga vignae]